MADYMSQSLMLMSPGLLQWRAETLPPLAMHEVLIQTRTGAISIGSELPHYCGTSRNDQPPAYPYMTGYESVGLVTACGSAVENVRVGDRVVAFYGHRTQAIVSAANVITIPETISDALALLTILSCDTAKGVRKLAPLPEQAVLITGAGAIGLLTLFILKAYGIVTVDIVEPQQERHALASQLGANTVYFPQSLPAASTTYPIAFECSSSNAAFALLQQQMQQHGRICVLADGNIEPLVLTPAFHTKELHIVGSSDGWDYHKHAVWYFQTVGQYTPALERLFQQEITQHQLIATFAELAQSQKRQARPVKVLVHYQP